MNRLVATLIVAASCGSIAYGQSPSSDPTASAEAPLTLSKALELAGASAPSLDAATAGVRAADAARTVAGLRPNPTINVEAENVAGTGPYSGTRSMEATTSLALPVELGGKRSARIAVAGAQRDRAIIERAVAQADLRLAVISGYAEAAASQRRLANAREQLRIASEAHRAAEARVRAGRASPIEVQRADVGRLNATAALERAERSASLATFALGQRIGRMVTAPVDGTWFEHVERTYGPTRSAEADGTLALAAAEADVATASAQVRLARAQRVPDVTVSAGARRLEATDDNAAVFSLSVPLPLFNSGNAAVAQARAEQLRSEAQRRAIAQDVTRSLAEAQAEAANAATSAATATGPALAAAQEAARIARIGYREGKFGQLELLDAERTLAETRASAIDALLAYHIAQAQLERLIAPAPTATEDR